VRPPTRGRRWLAIVAASALVLSVGCGDDEEQAGGSRLSLQFAGAVNGEVDADIDVDCFLPAEPGGTFSVSVDSEDGADVAGRTLVALDFGTPSYSGPKTYDVGAALQGDFTADSFFLLFKELEQQPFLWGRDQRSAGTITIDPSERSGRISLKGWENGVNMRVDVDGVFRCGEKEQKE
jgi:hypothetical protein